MTKSTFRVAAFRLRFVAISALFTTAVACSSDNENNDEVRQDTSASSLSCSSLSLCSSYWVSGTKAPLPARTGGTIADGTYVMVNLLSEDDSFEMLRNALTFKNGEFLSTGDGLGYGLGTYTLGDNKIRTTPRKHCRPWGADGGDASSSPLEADYAVKGDLLYVFHDDKFSVLDNGVYARKSVALVFQKYEQNDLCAAPWREHLHHHAQLLLREFQRDSA